MPSSRGIFPTQGSNTGLLRCRRILYCVEPPRKLFLKLLPGDFPGGPVVRTVGFHWQDLRSMPGPGIKILPILHVAKKKKNCPLDIRRCQKPPLFLTR